MICQDVIIVAVGNRISMVWEVEKRGLHFLPSSPSLLQSCRTWCWPLFFLSETTKLTTLWVERKVYWRGREEQNGGKARGSSDSQQGGVLELTDQDWMPWPKVVDLWGQIGLGEVPGKQKPPVALCLPGNNPSVYLSRVLLFRTFSSAQPLGGAQ